MVTFGSINEVASKVLILASGPSAEALNIDLVRKAQAAGVYVLAINRSYLWCPYIDGWFTLDPDIKLREFSGRRGDGITRYIAVPEDYGNPDSRVCYHRNAPINPEAIYLERVSGDLRYSAKAGLAVSPSKINTGNSAYGALGLAYHMRARKVVLIGVDADKFQGYAYLKGSPNNLNHLPHLFSTALIQLEAAGMTVINGSPMSRVKCFKRMQPDNAVKWLMQTEV